MSLEQKLEQVREMIRSRELALDELNVRETVALRRLESLLTDQMNNVRPNQEHLTENIRIVGEILNIRNLGRTQLERALRYLRDVSNELQVGEDVFLPPLQYQPREDQIEAGHFGKKGKSRKGKSRKGKSRKGKSRKGKSRKGKSRKC
jgi:hypothetical protein